MIDNIEIDRCFSCHGLWFDAGELDTTGAPTVVVRLGDLTQADGIQTVEFQVTID